MKIKPLFLLTSALLFSGASLQATDSICGGADDDQFRPPVTQGIVSDTLGVHGSPAPGHPAPLQPVLQGLVTDPLGLPPPPSGPQNPAIAKLDQLDEASIRSLIRQIIHGNDGNDLQPPATRITGDGGADSTREGPATPNSMWTDMSGTSLTKAIVGGGDADSLLPRLRFAVSLIYGETGSDSLHGDDDSDTLVRKLAYFVVGNTGADRLASHGPSNRMARLQQVAFSTGARSDTQFLSGVILGSLTGDSMDDDDLWGGGGTDE